MTAVEPHSRIQVCVDCADDALLAPFWAVALDYEPFDPPGGWRHLYDPSGTGPMVWFQTVPEPKVAKNRLHLDVWFADEAGAVVKRDQLTALGGTVVRRAFDFWLMHDPEGNEFCLCFPPPHAASEQASAQS